MLKLEFWSLMGERSSSRCHCPLNVLAIGIAYFCKQMALRAARSYNQHGFIGRVQLDQGNENMMRQTQTMSMHTLIIPSACPSLLRLSEKCHSRALVQPWWHMLALHLYSSPSVNNRLHIVAPMSPLHKPLSNCPKFPLIPLIPLKHAVKTTKSGNQMQLLPLSSSRGKQDSASPL